MAVWLLTMAFVVPFYFSSSNNAAARDGKSNAKPHSVAQSNIHQLAQSLYEKVGLGKLNMAYDVFEKAYTGFSQLQAKGLLNSSLLAIVDMSVPSGKKRLYIIDMEKTALLINTYVAHGRNSGDVLASKFSNKPESLQTSLGFYITENTYVGNNGYSLRLKGVEKSINDKAMARAIVMHGAPYVNEHIAKSTGRIGRSWGCPAVSMQEHKQIIDILKGGSCLFIYAPQKDYLVSSQLLKAHS